MQQPTDNSSRKKFLFWGAAALASVSALKIFTRANKKKEVGTVRMLTQDGRLVEIDKNRIAVGKKVSDKELQQWIKK
ncbi:hypothetical protein CAP36_08505 [Chitinophagaceae bacterium IBVUCB2]|nr:hypothetical protein CAP36_08505 [Chitinophagaceae bacterium IBVUCB2]